MGQKLQTIMAIKDWLHKGIKNALYISCKETVNYSKTLNNIPSVTINRNLNGYFPIHKCAIFTGDIQDILMTH